ncbi:U1 snRNP protein [Polyrhizophydium stewartii]|uniref:U1 snRNP protein n=1 Tax=Polyrhizophydium stewartii TaxID=2732419 RepID=A0ABR4N844_9FUNG
MLGDPPATASLAEGLRGLVQSILASVARLRSRLEEAEALAQHAQAIATLALSLPEAAGDETLPSLLVDVGPTLNDIGRFLAETASKNVVQQTLNARKTRTAIKDFEARLAKLELSLQGAADTLAAASPGLVITTVINLDVSDSERLVLAFPGWCASKGITATNVPVFSTNTPLGFSSLMDWQQGWLVSLDLVDQAIQGPLTPLIGGFRHLQRLEIQSNQLESLPASIGGLAKLQHLRLSRNKLALLPDSIGDLKELVELSLDANKLGTLPASIGGLSKLQKLHLDSNQLKSLPASIVELNKLQYLSLRRNMLALLPDEIGGLKSLYALVSGNQITSIPEQISNLSGLKILELIASMELTAVRSIANAASAKALAINTFAFTQATPGQPETAGNAAVPQRPDAQFTLLETIEALLEQTSEHSHLLQLLLAGKTATLISELDKEMHASNAHSEAVPEAVEQDKSELAASIERFVAATGTKFDVQSHRLETLSAIKKHGGALLEDAPDGVLEQLQTILDNASLDIVRRSGRGVSTRRNWTIDPDDVLILHNSKIGEGTLGEVYPARWHGKQVAVKVFPNAAGPAATQLIEREAFVWSQLQHENVLRLHGVCLDADKPFVVMPFVREDAASLLTMAQSVSVEMRTAILLGIARGMQHLHDRQPPVIHGGLKANAARISDDGTVLISEFGMSLVKANSSRNTARRADDTRWVAPEVHDSGYKLAKPSDVFSFAMTAVEVLTGDVPFGRSVAGYSALAKIKAGERPSRPDGVSDALWQIIVDCWQQDPTVRPPFAQVVARLEKLPVVPLDLEQILTTQRMSSMAESAVATASSCVEIAQTILMGRAAFKWLSELSWSVASALVEHLVPADHGLSVAEAQAVAQSVTDIKLFQVWIADMSLIGQALLFWTTIDRIRRFGDALLVAAASARLGVELDARAVDSAVNISIHMQYVLLGGLISATRSEFDVPSRRLETLSAIEAHGEQLVADAPDDLKERLRTLLAATKQSLESEVGQYLPASREWAVDPDSVQFAKGTRRCIGRGGFGVVHRGKWDGKDVAVKVIHGKNIKTQIDILEREICVWFSLQHDNVLPLLRVCLATEQPFFVMPLMLHSAIDAVLRRPDMSIDERIGILLDTARGMRYLHKRQPPVIHSDLRADNVLIDSNGRAHVADFGLSFIKTSSNDDAWCRTGAVRWVAPEVHQKGYRLDLPSDVFSFAMTAIEILTGNAPFEEEHNDGIVQDWIEEGERPYRPDGVPDPLWSLLEDCWDQDAAARPTFREVVKRLESLGKTCGYVALDCIAGHSAIVAATNRESHRYQAAGFLLTSGFSTQPLFDQPDDWAARELLPRMHERRMLVSPARATASYRDHQFAATAGFFRSPMFDASLSNGVRYLIAARCNAIWSTSRAVAARLLRNGHPFVGRQCPICRMPLGAFSPVGHLITACTEPRIQAYRDTIGFSREFFVLLWQHAHEVAGLLPAPDVNSLDLSILVLGGTLCGGATLGNDWLAGFSQMGTVVAPPARRVVHFLQRTMWSYSSSLWAYHRNAAGR